MNLAELSLGSGTATVLVSTKAVDYYDACGLGVTGGPVTLPQGVTVLLPNSQPAGDVTRATQLPETACPAEHPGSGVAVHQRLRHHPGAEVRGREHRADAARSGNMAAAPAAWNSAIGITAGSKDLAQPGHGRQQPDHPRVDRRTGREQRRVATIDLRTVDSGRQRSGERVAINKAELLFAPAGGKDAAGYVIKPGATLVFDSVIGCVPAHVDGSIAVLPSPSLTANVSIGSFKIGTVNFDQGTTLGLNFIADPAKPKADFMFSGGFTDSVSKVSFHAKVDLGASSDLARAGVALSITGGRPKYLSARADLNGQVSASASTGFAFSASGNGRLLVNGDQDLGNVSFSYSSKVERCGSSAERDRQYLQAVLRLE